LLRLKGKSDFIKDINNNPQNQNGGNDPQGTIAAMQLLLDNEESYSKVTLKMISSGWKETSALA
jgi:hypothetical protein